MNITQAERDAMVKRFEASNECRLRPRDRGDGWFFNYDVIYGDELKRLIEMIRGAETKPVCPYCGPAPFGMDVDRCPVHGVGCA